LKFFIVSSNQIPGGRFIDTEQFPKLGFIANAPDLAIKTLKKVTLQEQRERLIANNPNQKTWAIKFFLTEADAPRLESFTSNNIDNNVLMTFGDEPLLSASISEPISGGILGVTLTNQVIVEEARRRLATQ
jgi:preprotein translocase subunit SecD